MKAFDVVKPQTLNKILFAGEIMPVKQLNEWRKNVKALYANLYGPTEVTDICTYYILDREFKEMNLSQSERLVITVMYLF